MKPWSSRVAVTLCAVLAWAACNRRATADRQPQPAVANSQPASPPAKRATVLASTEESCDRIVADDTQVFWTTRSVEQGFAPESTAHTGHVLSCPVAGCGPSGPTLVAAGQSHVDALALDARYVYWTQRGFHGQPSDIMRCARSGCVAPETVHAHAYQGRPHGGGPSALAVDDGRILWVDYEESAIDECPIEGCGANPVVLAKVTPHPGNLTLAGGVAYWTNEDGSVMKCAETGCGSQPVTLGSATGQPADIVADDARVVWVNHRAGADAPGGHASQILSCPTSGCGGPPRVLVTTENALGTLAYRNTRLYWTERGSAEGDIIRTCSVEHCVPTTVLTGVEADGLTVSGAGLFWTEARVHQIQMLSPST